MKKRIALTVALSLISFGVVQAGTISVSPVITSDATSGIDVTNNYTHAISGSTAQTVNGVVFDALTPAATPANFTWDSSTNKSNLVNNFGAWDHSALAGQGVELLLRDFTFAGDGAAVGQSQTYTLSGLTPNTAYEARVYIRKWANDTTRDMTLTFTNGAEVDAITFREDRAEEPPISLPARDDAYYLSYAFTAEGTEMSINAEVAAGGNGSFHLYALTNHDVIPEPTSLVLALLGLVGLLGCGRRRRR